MVKSLTQRTYLGTQADIHADIVDPGLVAGNQDFFGEVPREYKKIEGNNFKRLWVASPHVLDSKYSCSCCIVL